MRKNKNKKVMGEEILRPKFFGAGRLDLGRVQAIEWPEEQAYY
jgi:hypothetical protein